MKRKEVNRICRNTKQSLHLVSLDIWFPASSLLLGQLKHSAWNMWFSSLESHLQLPVFVAAWTDHHCVAFTHICSVEITVFSCRPLLLWLCLHPSKVTAGKAMEGKTKNPTTTKKEREKKKQGERLSNWMTQSQSYSREPGSLDTEECLHTGLKKV